MRAEGYVFAIGIGDGESRKRIFEKYDNLYYPALVHTSASFGRRQKEIVESTQGSIVCAGVRLTNSIAVGNFCVFNINTTIGHDCVIEDFVTISPGANVSGNVCLSKGSYIGTGASILQGRSIDNKMVIGEKSVVGAGAVVSKSVDCDVVVVGIPAKPISKVKK